MKENKIVFEKLDEWIIDADQVAEENKEIISKLSETNDSLQIEGNLSRLTENFDLIKSTFSKLFGVKFPKELDYKLVSTAELKQLADQSSTNTKYTILITFFFNTLIAIAVNTLTSDGFSKETWLGIYIVSICCIIMLIIFIVLWHWNHKKFRNLEDELIKR